MKFISGKKIFWLIFSVILFFGFVLQAEAAGLIVPANNLGLIGYWSFEDGHGEIATDFSGNGRIGTLMLMEQSDWVKGKRGRGLLFDGVNDFVEVRGITDADTELPYPLTFSMWANIEATTGLQQLLSQDSTTGHFQWFVDVDDKSLQFANPNAAGTSNAISNVQQWNHYAVTISAAGNLTFYVNGASAGTASGLAALSWNPPSFLRFGKVAADTTEIFKGTMDEVRIYNRALSSAEISSLYQQTGFTRVTTSLTRTRVNTSQNNSITKGIVGLWSFDGPDLTTTTAADRSGQGNNGALNAPTGSGAASITHVQTFQATPTQYGASTETDPSESFTTPPTAGNLVVVTAGTYSVGGCDVPNVSVADNRGNTYNQAVYAQSANAAHDAQVHIWYAENVATGNPFTVTFHENGCDIAFALHEYSGVATSGALTGTASSTGNSTTASTGAINPADSGSLYVGAMSHVGSTRTLTESWTLRAEQEAGNTGAVMAMQELVSSGSQTGTWTIGTGAVQWVGGVATFKPATVAGNAAGMQPTIGRLGQGLSFDGVDDYVTVTDASPISLTSAMTTSFWFKTATTSAQMFIDKRASTNNSYEAGVTGGNLYFLVDTGSAVSATTTVSTFADNEWHHFAGVYDGANVSLYIDGVLKDAPTQTGSMTDTTDNLIIGADTDLANEMSGVLDDIRLYNRAFDSTEVKSLYRLGGK